MRLSPMKKALITIFSVIFLDQLIKFIVKLNMRLEQDIPLLGDFFKLIFIENNGMAFGMELGGTSGKIILSVFRVVAVIAIGYYLYSLTKKKASGLLIVCISLIFAGALGNIIDSMFYGLIFSASSLAEPAVLFPPGGGYEGFLEGKVVDMFHFNVYWPKWVPNLGGTLVFPPIFNTADASISIGVLLLVIFQKRVFGKKKEEEEPVSQEASSEGTVA